MDSIERTFMRLFLSALTLLFVVGGCHYTLAGMARSRWLRETRGIDMPWYEAATVQIDVNDTQTDIDANIEGLK